MSDPKDHNPQAAGIYRAIALRFYSRYVQARGPAERHGGDLSGYGSQHGAREADERYKAAIDEAIGEIPESIDAALALAHFAGILAADRFIGEITQEPVNDERDAYHQSRALADLARWINQLAIDELVEQERRKKAENCKLRAVGSQDDGDDDADAA
jgi:hypothetical protein